MEEFTQRKTNPKKQATILTACELLQRHRPALLVYAALRELAQERMQFKGTRKTLAENTGLNKKTISKALRELASAGWIILRYGSKPDQHRKWYRISFVFPDFLPSPALVRKRKSKRTELERRGPKTRRAVPRGSSNPGIIPELTKNNMDPQARQTGPRDGDLEPSNGSKGSVPLDPPDGSLSLEREGSEASPPSPPLHCGFGGSASPKMAEVDVSSILRTEVDLNSKLPPTTEVLKRIDDCFESLTQQEASSATRKGGY